ncbi:contact-dependent growth inhibition system immunity protein [Testudinibacter sp. P80/BLE/0925]|uniref:contact-dependent growth inhibition system immunity protein n=1 Tax=Testudinibacter sp. TW-1 TaxID=3417757 RepID=UPI003D36248F
MAKSKNILIRKNKDVILITYFLQGLLSMSDPEQDPVFLPVDIDDKMLGESAKEALLKSREIPLDEFYKIFNSGEVQLFGKKIEQQLQEHFGYKSRKAIYNTMDFLSIDMEDNITITPHHQDSLDGSTAVKKKDGTAIEFEYPLEISDEELGMKIREAFKYCTSIYRK